MAQDQGRALKLLDDVRHREGLARTGNAEQGHGIHSAVQCFADAFYRRRLVARGLVFRVNLEFHVSRHCETLVGRGNLYCKYTKTYVFPFRKFYYLCVILNETRFIKQ